MKVKRGTQQTIAHVATALASTRDLSVALAGVAAAIGEGEDASHVQVWALESGSLVCRAAWAASTPGDDGSPTRGRKAGHRSVFSDDPFDIPGDTGGIGEASGNGSGPEGLGHELATGVTADLGARPDLRAVLDGAQLVEWCAGPDTPESLATVLEALGATRTATLAIRVGDETVGALTTAHSGPTIALTAAEKKRLSLSAELVAAAVRAATVAASGDAALRQADALRNATRAVNDLVESDQAVEAIKHQIAALVGGSECKTRVFLRTQLGTYAEFPPRPDPDQSGLFESEGLSELEMQAIAEQRTLSVSTARAVRLAAPLLLRGAPLGYLTLIVSRSQPLSPLEVEGVDALARQICAALDVARLRRSVQRLTTIDAVTGLRNREFLFERLAAEIARARRYKQPLSLVLLDFDDLTRFNARHGNHEGNRLLRTAANLVKMSVRDNVDVACRFTGGEFALLLPNTPASAKGAGTVAERIRRMIETTQFRDENDHKVSPMTASLGVAGHPEHAEDAEDLLELATEAVKAAKAAGKNRVGLYNAQR